MDSIPDAAAVILAGGLSRRMGQDKANLVLGQHTLLQTLVQTLSPLFPQQLYLSVRQPRTEINLPQIIDTQDNAGPLAGIAAVLAHTQSPWLFVVACDMPFLTQSLVTQLAQQRSTHQAVVPVVQQHLQPLAAFYAQSSLPILQQHLSQQQFSIQKAIRDLDACYVAEAELMAGNSFFDLDTPEDVVCGERFLNECKSS